MAQMRTPFYLRNWTQTAMDLSSATYLHKHVWNPGIIVVFAAHAIMIWCYLSNYVHIC